MTSTPNKSVPTLRFKDDAGKDYPGWGEKHIQNICEINPSSDSLPNNFTYIDLESVYQGSLIKENKVSKSSAPSRAQRILKMNDVLFQTVRPYQQNNLFFDLKGDYVASTGYAQLRAETSSLFLYFLLHGQKFARTVLTRCTGTSYPAINSNDIGTIKVYVPVEKEQQKIAAFLSAVDTKIEQLNRKKSLLAQYKKGMMQKLFSQDIRFKDDEGKDYPDWEKVKFSSLYSFQSTNSYSRDRLDYKDGRVRNIHYGDIHTKYRPGFELDRENVPFLESGIDLRKVSKASYCKEGDLVIADASEDYSAIGKTIELLNLNSEKVLAGLHTLLARLNTDRIHVGYGAFVMACRTVKLQVMKIAHGTKVLGISAGRMGEIELPLPSREEQQKIADFLSAIDRKIELVTSQLEQSRTFKKGLLQMMFV